MSFLQSIRCAHASLAARGLARVSPLRSSAPRNVAARSYSTPNTNPTPRKPSSFPAFAALAAAGAAGAGGYYLLTARDSPLIVEKSQDDATKPSEKAPAPALTPAQIDALLSQSQQTIALKRKDLKIKRIDVCVVGSNEPCEDRWFIEETDDATGGGVLLGVIDGHIGEVCAEKAKNTLPTYIKEHLAKSKSFFKSTSSSISQALTNAFDAFDADLINLPLTVVPNFASQTRESIAAIPAAEREAMMKKLLPSFAGAVGLVAYITPKTIHLAHAGDVRCVAQSTDGQIHSTMDHQAETPSEAARLRKEHPGEEDTVVCLRKGEEPSADGQQPPLRVIGLLMPSRSFGDAHSKWSVEWQEKLKPILEFFPTAKRLGIAPLCKTPPYITAHPDITPLPHPGQRFLVISTDGITDSLSSEDIASTVSSTLATEDSQNKNLAGILARKALGGGKFDDEEAGRRLALEGRERREWRDDITVLVVVFE